MSFARARVLLLLVLFPCGLIAWMSWPAEDLTLPAPRYGDSHDVVYFPPGPDFPLANEEAALAETAVSSEQ